MEKQECLNRIDQCVNDIEKLQEEKSDLEATLRQLSKEPVKSGDIVKTPWRNYFIWILNPKTGKLELISHAGRDIVPNLDEVSLERYLNEDRECVVGNIFDMIKEKFNV